MLSMRKREPEDIDQPGLDVQQHEKALRGLARIHRWTGSARTLLRPVLALARELRASRLSVLDLASGGGELAIAVWRKAGREGLDLHIRGCDLSPRAVEYARRMVAGAGADLEFFQVDALAAPLPQADVVMTTLFLHHLPEEQAVMLLQRMAQAARRLVIVYDLARSTAGLALTHVGTRLLLCSRIVHDDGMRSVRAAFTIGELRVLAGRAGLHNATVQPAPACRLLLQARTGADLASTGLF